MLLNVRLVMLVRNCKIFSASGRPVLAFQGVVKLLFMQRAVVLLGQSTSSPFTAGLLDDITLGGPKASVVTDRDLIKSKGSEIALILNVSKCEVIRPLTVQ